MKRIFSILLVIIMMLSVFSGCSNKNGNDTIASEETTPEATTPEITTPGATTPNQPDDPDNNDLAAWMTHSMEKLTPTSGIPSKAKRDTKLTIYMGKGESESASLAIYSAIRRGGCSIKVIGAPDDIEVTVYKQHFQVCGKKEYADGLSYVTDTMLLKKDSISGFFITVTTTKDTAPGDKKMIIELSDNEGKTLATYELTAHVWNITYDDKHTYDTATDLEEDIISKYHNAKWNSTDPEEIAKFEEFYVAYYEMLLDYRMCAYNLPYDILDDRADKYMSDPRVTAFQIPTNVDDDTLVAYYNKVKSNPDWLEKAYAYPKDEPTDKEMYDDVISVATRIKKLCPELKIVVPFFKNFPYDSNRDAIDIQSEYLDILCVKSKCFHEREFALKVPEKQAEGDLVWAYVCWEPGYPYTNLYVNEKGLNHRIQFWQQYNINADGFLYWSSNYWGGISNPWTTMATVPNLDPNVYGDGSLLYSGIGKDKNGEAVIVLPSVRLDIVRDGIEDAELLKMAEKVLGREAVLELVKPVAKDMVNYTSSVSTLQNQRIAIAEALMAASK